MDIAPPEEEINVLFVDDDRDILELAKKFFSTEERIDLTVSGSAKKGIELLEDGNFDVIVSDYSMPEMDGIEFLEALRSDGNDIPFIVLTGQGEEEVAMKALNLGADKYQRKDMDLKSQFDKLVETITKEALKSKTEKDLDTFETWLKNSLEEESEEKEMLQ